MVTEFLDQRVVVIDGNACLKVATKKAMLFAKRANLNIKSAKDIINLMYHFFIVESLSLKRPLKLKFRCTIVFYVDDLKSQLKNTEAAEYLVKKLKKTSPIPVFTMDRRNNQDLPHAAECCVEKSPSNMQAFYKHINTQSLNALKRMYSTQISIEGLDEEPL